MRRRTERGGDLMPWLRARAGVNDGATPFEYAVMVILTAAASALMLLSYLAPDL